MSNRHLPGWRVVLGFAAIAAIVLFSVSTVSANSSLGALGPADPSDTGDDTRPLAQSSDDPGRRHIARYHPRSNYVWPYSSGPSYGQHIVGEQILDDEVVPTPVGLFRAGSDATLLAPELRGENRLDRQSMQHFIVKLHQTAKVSAIESIERSGGSVVGYLDTQTYRNLLNNFLANT